MNCIRTPVRKGVRTLKCKTHHVVEPTKRVVMESGPAIAHRLWGSSGAAVGRSGYTSATTVTVPRSNHCW
jgi:hypothetical protein